MTPAQRVAAAALIQMIERGTTPPDAIRASLAFLGSTVGELEALAALDRKIRARVSEGVCAWVYQERTATNGWGPMERIGYDLGASVIPRLYLASPTYDRDAARWLELVPGLVDHWMGIEAKTVAA